MTLTIEDLHDAIDALIVRQRLRLYRDGGIAEWHTLPSLWEQLEAATGYQGTGTGSAGGRARLPISADVVSLLIDVASTVSEAVMEHAGQNRHTVPGNLRLLATRLADENADDDGLDWWVDKVRHWIGQAKTALRLNATRPRWARGVRCPDCGADTVTAQQDGETVRRPALSIQWAGPEDENGYTADDQWRVRAVSCDACATSWWRGSDLDTLVEQMLAYNLSRETLAVDATRVASA